MKRVPLFLLTLLACHALRGAGEEPGFPNPSRFDAGAIRRNPFTPVRAAARTPEAAAPSPTASAPAREKAAPRLDPAQFKVTSLSVAGGHAAAIINGRPYGVGDTLPADGGGKVVVVRIDGEGVFLDAGGGPVKIPLSRGEP